MPLPQDNSAPTANPPWTPPPGWDRPAAGGDYLWLSRAEDLANYVDFAGRLPASIGGTNARPSGGLFTTGHSGVNMAWACIRVLLGQDQAPLVPQPNSRYLNMDTAIPHNMTPQAAVLP